MAPRISRDWQPVTEAEITKALSVDGTGHRKTKPTSEHTSRIAYRILRARNFSFPDQDTYRVFHTHLYLRLQKLAEADKIERDPKLTGLSSVFWMLAAPADGGAA